MKQAPVAAVALVLALLALPAAAGGQGAETFTESQTIPFDQVVHNPCSGEEIVVSGEVHLLAHQTLDATGGDHAVLLENLVRVTGTSATGTEYIYRLVTVQPFNNPEGRGVAPQQPGVEFSSNQSMRVIATDGTDDFILNVRFHVTVNANGEPTVVFEQVDARCVG